MNLLNRIYRWLLVPRFVCQNCRSSDNERGKWIKTHWYIFCERNNKFEKWDKKKICFWDLKDRYYNPIFPRHCEDCRRPLRWIQSFWHLFHPNYTQFCDKCQEWWERKLEEGIPEEERKIQKFVSLK